MKKTIGNVFKRSVSLKSSPLYRGRHLSLQTPLALRKKRDTTRRRGRLRVAVSTVPDPTGSGRVDMLKSPVAAAQAAVATGAWVKSKHMYLVSDTWKCGTFSFIFTHPPEDSKIIIIKKSGLNRAYERQATRTILIRLRY